VVIHKKAIVLNYSVTILNSRIVGKTSNTLPSAVFLIEEESFQMEYSNVRPVSDPLSFTFNTLTKRIVPNQSITVPSTNYFLRKYLHLLLL
jgi:hypothetical protein